MNKALHEFSDIQVSVDSFDSDFWQNVLSSFSDANIYNVWNYEGSIHPRSQVSRMILTRGGRAVGLVQTRIIFLPMIRRGLAFIRWGPIWRPREDPANIENLRECMRAIFAEYAVRRRLLVRVVPSIYSDDLPQAESVIFEEGFRRVKHLPRRKTLIMDLKPSLEEIRDNLHVKWRAHLKRALKKDQRVISGDTDDLFALFEKIYKGMRERKGFVSFTDFKAFRRLQSKLPPAEKLRVILCGSGSEYYSGAVVSALGSVGLYLFGATNGKGLENNGSYPVQWHAIEWLKEQGCTEYDLNGINPEINPTTYMYKSRLAGRTRREVEELGAFEAHTDSLGRMFVQSGMTMIGAWRNLRLRRSLNPRHTNDD